MVTLRVSAKSASEMSTPTRDRIHFAEWFEVLLTNISFTEALVFVSRILENHK